MTNSPFANTIHKIINEVYVDKNIIYLELGLNCGTNFNSLQIDNKISVDIKFTQTKPTYLMSTDDFFLQNKLKFNLIYIDADHEYSQVIKDFNNSVDSIEDDGIIFLHDLFPPDEYHTHPNFCYNSYKILNYLIQNNYDIIINRDDFGACAVFNPKKIDINNFEHGFSYNSLVSNYKNHESIYENYSDFLKKYKEKINE